MARGGGGGGEGEGGGVLVCVSIQTNACVLCGFKLMTFRFGYGLLTEFLPRLETPTSQR